MINVKIKRWRAKTFAQQDLDIANAIANVHGGFKHGNTNSNGKTKVTPKSSLWNQNFLDKVIADGRAVKTMSTYEKGHTNLQKLLTVKRQDSSKRLSVRLEERKANKLVSTAKLARTSAKVARVAANPNLHPN